MGVWWWLLIGPIDFWGIVFYTELTMHSLQCILYIAGTNQWRYLRRRFPLVFSFSTDLSAALPLMKMMLMMTSALALPPAFHLLHSPIQPSFEGWLQILPHLLLSTSNFFVARTAQMGHLSNYTCAGWHERSPLVPWFGVPFDEAWSVDFGRQSASLYHQCHWV